MTRRSPPLADASTSRRAVLAGLAGLAVGGSGCLQRARSVMNRSGPEPISLSIKTVPTDSDPRSILIARFLAEQLGAVGIDAEIVPMRPEEFLLDVLVDRQFDVYVARHPGNYDPDFLRPFLHSRFGSESGWQNPFGYANLEVDDLLVRQRQQAGRERTESLWQVQRMVATDCPFVVVAFPDDIRAVRTDRIAGWTDYNLHTPESYLRLREHDADSTPSAQRGDPPATVSPESTEGEPDVVEMTLTDQRATKNLNPLSVEFRDVGTITGLLYDPLARWIDGRLRPWLAASWRWVEEEGPGDAEMGPVLEVTLRDDLAWHDGEPLTASDVAFTHAFLQDTSLGELDIPVPAPRFREWSSLVAHATASSDRTVTITFEPCSRETAARALTVPPLPAHVWRERAAPVTIANIGDDTVTEALVSENMDPVGSGALQFAESTVNERVVLEPFPDHFLAREGPEGLEGVVGRFAGGFAFDRLSFLVAPSGEGAVEMLLSGDADGTASAVMPHTVPSVGVSNVTRLQVERSRGFYHVGFNVRESPLSNARFRRAVAQLLDKAYISRAILQNYARPATSPLAPYDALAPDLAWEGEDAELPYPGEDGELDVDRALEPFVEAGYRYREEDGVLVS